MIWWFPASPSVKQGFFYLRYLFMNGLHIRPVFFNLNSWLFLPFHSCPIHRLSGYPWVRWYFFCPGHQSPRRFPCLQFNCQSYNFLPLVSNAFRVNLFSALLACMTLVVLYLSAIEIIKICFPESSSELRIGPALLPPALPSGSNL